MKASMEYLLSNRIYGILKTMDTLGSTLTGNDMDILVKAMIQKEGQVNVLRTPWTPARCCIA